MISVAVTALLGLLACASPAAAVPVVVTSSTVVVDVRTASEYAGGITDASAATGLAVVDK